MTNVQSIKVVSIGHIYIVFCILMYTNYTLDLILSHGINVDDVEILQQNNDIPDHYLVSAEAAKSTFVTNMTEQLSFLNTSAYQIM